MHEHHEQVQALIPDVEAITGALNDLVSSERFVELLKLVLAVGNYMNGGSFRGGAAGFKLDTLGKLADVRSTTHAGQTLLDFIVKLGQDKLPSVASGLEDELQNVEAGAGVAFSNIATELTSLQRAFKQSSAKMTSLQDAAGSGALRAKLEPALRAAGEELARLEANVKNVEELRVSVLVRFGEDPKSADIEEILHLVVNFLASWRASGLKGGKSKGVPSLRKESAQANVLDDKFADLATGNFRQSQRRSHPR